MGYFATFVLLFTALEVITGLLAPKSKVKTANLFVAIVFAVLMALNGLFSVFLRSGFTARYVSEEGQVCTGYDDVGIPPNCHTVVLGKYFYAAPYVPKTREESQNYRRPFMTRGDLNLLLVLVVNGAMPVWALLLGVWLRGWLKATLLKSEKGT